MKIPPGQFAILCKLWERRRLNQPLSFEEAEVAIKEGRGRNAEERMTSEAIKKVAYELKDRLFSNGRNIAIGLRVEGEFICVNWPQQA
jgi:hypothetical protein